MKCRTTAMAAIRRDPRGTSRSQHRAGGSCCVSALASIASADYVPSGCSERAVCTGACCSTEVLQPLQTFKGHSPELQSCSALQKSAGLNPALEKMCLHSCGKPIISVLTDRVEKTVLLLPLQNVLRYCPLCFHGIKPVHNPV